MAEALSAGQIAGLNWNLLNEDLRLPTAVLYEDKLAHNLAWMQKFAEAYGAKLAPHGKTTMAPKLFLRQLQAGAWGITLATATHVEVAYEFGVRRVLMANQLVGQQNMAAISRLLRDPAFEFYCLVDSASNIESLQHFFQAAGQRLNVLIELGVNGGRAGVRDREQLGSLLTALDSAHGTIALCGIEVFEGVLAEEAAIRELLQLAVTVTKDLSAAKRFHRSPVILTGGGSAWYDIVAEIFSNARLSEPIEILLRPGCYLTHDVGIYREAQQKIMHRNQIARGMGSSLVLALQLWAYVQSIPERNRAIIGLGKRDAAFDAGLPIPALHYRPGNSAPVAAPAEWKTTRMMDQHAFLDVPEGTDICVGDMIGFNISHPCLTFDKWRYLPVLDSEYRVIDVVETFF